MKALMIISLIFSSLTVMSAEVGEDKKGECIYSNQSSKREAKAVDAPSIQDKKEAVRSTSK